MKEGISIKIVEMNRNISLNSTEIKNATKSSTVKCSNPLCYSPNVFVLRDSENIDDGCFLFCDGKENFGAETRDCQYGFKVSLVKAK